MARERLTSRARQAADDKTPYPGSINQEGREEEQRGSMTYRTFEPSVANHEMTDYTKVHGVSDQHNEIGFGIPDPASGMLVASADYQAKCIKAAELAETFLGPKVSDRMLLAQARDFLSMNDEVLDRTLERFNRTDTLYVAEEMEVEEEVEEEGEVEVDEEAMVEVAPVEEGPAQNPDPEITNIEETPVAPAPEDPACDCNCTTKVEEETSNPARDIPEMPEGQAASPQVNTMAPAAPVVEETAMVMSEEKATNLAQLAACTLQPHECTQANIVEQAKKFASMSDDQVKTLLASFGRTAVESEEVDGTEAACVAEEAPVEEAPAEVAGEACAEDTNEIDIASETGIDIATLDLAEELHGSEVAMSANDEAELASVFGGQAPQQEQIDPNEALTASIAALAGGRSKVASKVGVKSIGKVTLQNTQAQPEASELEGLWNSPGEFPGGGF
jgi:hypothetical protein